MIPKQHATSDTCATTDEYELFNFQHQFVFLNKLNSKQKPFDDTRLDPHSSFSSVFSIVYRFAHPFGVSADVARGRGHCLLCAREKVNFVLIYVYLSRTGIFSLSHRGVRVLTNCNQSGFHHHEPVSFVKSLPHYSELIRICLPRVHSACSIPYG